MSNVFEDLLGAYDQLRKRTYKIVVESRKSEEENLKQVAAGQPAKPIDQNAGSTLDQAAPGDVVEPDNSSNVTDDGQPNKYVVGDQGQLQKLEDDAENPTDPGMESQAPLNPYPGLEVDEDGKYKIPENLAWAAMEDKSFDDPLRAYEFLLNSRLPHQVFNSGLDPSNAALKTLVPTYLNLFKGLEKFLGSDALEGLRDSLRKKIQAREAYFDYSELYNKEFTSNTVQRYIAKYLPEELDTFYNNGKKDFFGSVLMDMFLPLQSIGLPMEGFNHYEDIQRVYSNFISNRKSIFSDEPELDFEDKSFSHAFNKVVGEFYQDPELGNAFIFRQGSQKSWDLVFFAPSVKANAENSKKHSLDFSGPRRKKSYMGTDDPFGDKVEKLVYSIADHANAFARGTNVKSFDMGADGSRITKDIFKFVDKVYELVEQVDTARELVRDDYASKGYSLMRNNDLQAIELLNTYGNENGSFKDRIIKHINELVKASGNFSHRHMIEDIPGQVKEKNFDHYHKVNGKTVCRMESANAHISTTDKKLKQDINSVIKLFGQKDFKKNPSKYHEIIRDLVQTYNPNFPGDLLFKGIHSGAIDHNYLVHEIVFKGVGKNGKTNAENICRDLLKGYYPLFGSNFKDAPENHIFYTELNGDEFEAYTVNANELNEHWREIADTAEYSYDPNTGLATFTHPSGDKVQFSIPALDIKIDDYETTLGFDIEYPTIKNHAEKLDDWVSTMRVDIPLDIRSNLERAPNFEAIQRRPTIEEIRQAALELFGEENINELLWTWLGSESGLDNVDTWNKYIKGGQLQKDMYAISQKSLEMRGLPEEFIVFRAGPMRESKNFVATSLNFYVALHFMDKVKDDLSWIDPEMRSKPNPKSEKQITLNQIEPTQLQAYKVRRDAVLIDQSIFADPAWKWEEELIVSAKDLYPVNLRVPKALLRDQEFRRKNISKGTAIQSGEEWAAAQENIGA